MAGEYKHKFAEFVRVKRLKKSFQVLDGAEE
jgi:hypothetical protein